MNAKYLGRISTLLHDARPRLGQTHDLEFKSFFGAVAAYLDGQLFASCGKFGVALKLPPRTLARMLEERGVKPLKYFPKGHVKKDYAVLPKRILADVPALKKLVDKSIAHVLSA
ncbi:MAG: TfoX/Sxy family protein [Candidatus Hydrogenedentes bacterium]|nr:TfoX/Sxy family protein [Candidatus Hydrogenedentota bacterium]